MKSHKIKLQLCLIINILRLNHTSFATGIYTNLPQRLLVFLAIKNSWHQCPRTTAAYGTQHAWTYSFFIEFVHKENCACAVYCTWWPLIFSAHPSEAQRHPVNRNVLICQQYNAQLSTKRQWIQRQQNLPVGAKETRMYRKSQKTTPGERKSHEASKFSGPFIERFQRLLHTMVVVRWDQLRAEFEPNFEDGNCMEAVRIASCHAFRRSNGGISRHMSLLRLIISDDPFPMGIIQILAKVSFSVSFLFRLSQEFFLQNSPCNLLLHVLPTNTQRSLRTIITHSVLNAGENRALGFFNENN